MKCNQNTQRFRQSNTYTFSRMSAKNSEKKNALFVYHMIAFTTSIFLHLSDRIKWFYPSNSSKTSSNIHDKTWMFIITSPLNWIVQNCERMPPFLVDCDTFIVPFYTSARIQIWNVVKKTKKNVKRINMNGCGRLPSQPPHTYDQK